MLDFEFLSRLSEALYGWWVDSYADTFHYLSTAGNPDDGYGMNAALFAVVIFSLLGMIIYYFGIASKAANATKKNMLIMLIVFWAISVVGTYLFVSSFANWPVNDDLLIDANMWHISVINFIVYPLLCELWGLIFKSGSKAKNIMPHSIFQ